MRCKKLREIPNAASTKFSWDPATPVCAPAVNSFFPSSGALSSVTHKAKNTSSSYSVLTLVYTISSGKPGVSSLST